MGGKGAKKSISEYGELGIETERGIYWAGERVEGNVCLVVNKGFPIKGIEIRLKGKERTKFRTGSGKHRHTHRGTHICCDYKGELITIKENIIMPGQYQFPFSFILPDSLPGSFYYKEGSKEGEISYELIAGSISADKSVSQLFYFLPFQLQQQMPTAKTNQKQSKHLRIVGCCSSPGDSILHYELDKNYLHTTDKINIQITIDNQNSLAPITNIRLKIIQKLGLKSTSGFNQHTHRKHLTVYERYMPAVVPAGGQLNEGIIFSVSIPEKYSQMPTTGGELVECSYTALITIYYEGCCISGEGTEFMLLMHYPEVERVNLEERGNMEWEPRVFRKSNLVMDQIINEPEGASYLDPIEMPGGEPQFGYPPQEDIYQTLQ